MAEVPTKPDRGAERGIERGSERGSDRGAAFHSSGDTLSAEPSRDPADGAAAIRPLPDGERYRLGAELGRGGMGRVVEAFDLQLGRTVAIKEVLPRAAASIARRFVREVQLTARLEHPSIVPLYDAGTTADGRPFYVMRRVSGRPLDQLMAQAQGLDGRLTLLPALLAAIDAVAHAHHRGVIHRDLKPANILVGELGETVVIDWGLAKVIGEDDDRPGTMISSDSLRTQMGSVFGTPGFMSPEQARGEALDPRSDVYALGATLYQLLAGAPPHAGPSASEVIARTGSREVAPIDSIAQGAPRELVAIVGKALAFDAAGRYPDAGALGEDVRRFLAGQLVAAHRYTRRQRLWRFARRHRAPLVVAALAIVAVAVLSSISVRRIIDERDAADRARREARREQAAAVQARDQLQHRTDQLVVMQARGLVASNPTHAVAVLKQLPDSSPRIGDARAVAQAAVVHGAAWAIEGSSDFVGFTELSPGARSLLHAGRDGTLRIWDLDRRKLVLARAYPPHARALWVGSAILVIDIAVPELLDPFTGPSGTVHAVPVGAIRRAAATTAGDRVAYLGDRGAAHLLDVATRTARPLWPGHHAEDIAIAPDGSWIALADKTTVVVLDGEGRELVGRAGAALRLVGSHHGHVAYLEPDKVTVCTLVPRPACTAIALPTSPGVVPVDLVFRGGELDVYMSSGKVMAWNGERMWERLRLGGLSFGLFVAGGELLVAPGIDGKLHVSNDLVRGELHLPVPLRNLRVAARPDAPRVVATGDGIIVGFDLADSFPAHIRRPAGTISTFVDDDTLLLWSQSSTAWEWHDLRSARSTPFTGESRGIPHVIDIDPGDGRVLIADELAEPALVLLRKGSAEQRRIARGRSVWGRLLPRGALMFGTGDGRVLAITDDRGPREVAMLDGIAADAVGLGGTMFAAVSTTGELVRGDLATGTLARNHLRAHPGAFAGDRAGRVLVAAGPRFLVWDRDLVEIARFAQRIVRIVPVADGALLELADHSIVRMALVTGAPVISLVPPSSHSPLISGDAQLIVAETVNGQVKVVEVSTRSSWELPAYFPAAKLDSISPSTRRFVQTSFGSTAMWTLPLAPPELRSWLDDRTGAATDADHALVWPWQRTSR
jgi:hypothetical protein